MSHHTVYESEVVGISLAADIMAEVKPQGKVAILLDNQAGIKSSTRRKHHSGHQLVKAAQDSLVQILNLLPTTELTIAWIPGHCDVEGNEVADVEAKKAARGLESGRVHPHPILERGIPRSAAAIKAGAKTRMAEEWGRDWKESPQGIQTAKFDPHPPSSHIWKFYSNCNRRETSLYEAATSLSPTTYTASKPSTPKTASDATNQRQWNTTC
jgi:hypothetical protein